MRFGHFDDEAREYVITTPHTPYPWINYLGSQEFFSLIEFCLWNAQDDQTNYQRNLSIGEVEIEGSAIYHVTEYRERRNHYAVYGVNAPIAGFDTDRTTFTGLYNGFGEADVPRSGKSANSVASGWYPIGSQSLDVTLAPGASTSYTFVLGYLENPKDDKWESPGVVKKTGAKELLARFATEEQTDAAFAALQQYWDDLLGSFTVTSPDEKLNRMVNVWNQYQCMVTFNIAATQFEDGGAYHQYQPLTKRGNLEVGSGFNDDPLWLIAGTAAYIKETGDFAILDEHVAFDNDESKAQSLFEHLKRSFFHVVDNVGPHGLPLIGRADWNDCLNLNCFSEEPGESFQTTENKAGGTAESVLIAGMFVHIGPEYVELAQRRGLHDEATTAQEHIDKMRETVLELSLIHISEPTRLGMIS